MGNWKVLDPEATTNKVKNPVAGTTGNFAATGGGTMTRVTTYSKYSTHCYRIQGAADNQGGSLTLATLANAIHYISILVYSAPAAGVWDWSLDNTNWHNPTKIMDIDDDWSLWGAQIPAAQANGSTTLYILQDGGTALDVYIDRVQVEEKEYWTSLCTGDEPGCEWAGYHHASESTRSALVRRGGRLKDLKDDFGFGVSTAIDVGDADFSVFIDEYAALPGGELSAIRDTTRQFALVGIIFDRSGNCDLHTQRAALLDLLKREAYPKDDRGWQPIVLWYTGADTVKKIEAHLISGLGARIGVEEDIQEQLNLVFKADQPHWTAIGEESAVMDHEDTSSMRAITARLKSTGQWDNLGNPSSGVAATIYAIAEDAKYAYIGGTFTNWNGNGNSDYVARIEKSTGTWSAMSQGVNSQVLDVKVGVDGKVYVTGTFTNILGIVGCTRMAVWDPVAETWACMGSGLNNTGWVLDVAHDGQILIGGSFTTAGGGAHPYFAQWNPITSIYSSPWGAPDNFVYAIAVDPRNGNIYVGGAFANVGAVSATRIAMWDGTNWTALGAGMNNDVLGLACDQDGTLYAVGLFTTAGGVTVNYIAKWNGVAWEALGAGASATARVVKIGPDGMVYIGGDFMDIGGLGIADRAARWNGYTYAHLDIDLPGTPSVYEFLLGKKDPIINSNYDIWVGFNTTGTGTYGGLVTVSNDGSTDAFPIITLERSGGTNANLATIRNETLGLELLFDYDLLDGETLTIDFRPTKREIKSNFFGARPDAVLKNCDFDQFRLMPGDNKISCYINEQGTPTLTTTIQWVESFRGFDG